MVDYNDEPEEDDCKEKNEMLLLRGSDRIYYYVLPIYHSNPMKIWLIMISKLPIRKFTNTQCVNAGVCYCQPKWRYNSTYDSFNMYNAGTCT